MSASNPHLLSRRNLLAGATSTGILLAGAPSFAQPRGRRGRAPSIPVKKISPSLYLTRETARAAANFQVGGKRMPLRVAVQHAAGVVHQFPLRRDMASKLDRQSSLLEAATIGISDPQSLGRLRKHVASSDLQLSKTAQSHLEQVPFFFVQAAWREGTGRDARALANSKRQLVTARHHLAFALVPLEGSAQGINTAMLVIVSQLADIVKGWIVDDDEKKPPEDDTNKPPEGGSSSSGNEDNTKDFAECYLGCIDEAMDNYIILLAAAALCGTCTAAMAALTFPGTQEVAIPAAVATCTMCAGAIGAVAGNCLVGCHEML